MNILHIVLYVYRMIEHTKCSIVVHYELDKGIESEKKIVCIVLWSFINSELTFKMQQTEFLQAVVNIKKYILC